MAAESIEDEVVDHAEKNVEMSGNNEVAGTSQWVSFEEECEVPLLPQPPSQGDNMNSEKYIDRLEQKLHRIKNPSNITSKNIVSALAEARESQMNNMMNDTADSWNAFSQQTHDELDCNDEFAEPRCCCVVMYDHLFPKRAKTSQEVECLLDEDELAIVNSELVDNTLPDQPIQPAMVT